MTVTDKLQYAANDQSIKERVQNGVDLLDERVPEWRNKVHAETLAMHDCFNCIIGQVFGLRLDGEFSQMIRKMNVDPFEHGFDAYVDEYKDLTKEWRRQLDGG